MMALDWHLDVRRTANGHCQLDIYERPTNRNWNCRLAECTSEAIFDALRVQLAIAKARPVPARDVRIITDEAQYWSDVRLALGIRRHTIPSRNSTLIEAVAQHLIDNGLLAYERWRDVIPLVEQILAEEGAAVTFTGPNPDFNDLPNEAVGVTRSPGWFEKTYRADTLADCLRAAIADQQTDLDGKRDSSADATPDEADADADTAAVQNMIVWASGMVEFIGDRPEPDGAILICTAHGRAAIDALLKAVDESADLHDFGGRIAKRVPGIHPDDPAPDVHELIYWGDDLRNDLGARSDIQWVRQ